MCACPLLLHTPPKYQLKWPASYHHINVSINFTRPHTEAASNFHFCNELLWTSCFLLFQNDSHRISSQKWNYYQRPRHFSGALYYLHCFLKRKPHLIGVILCALLSSSQHLRILNIDSSLPPSFELRKTLLVTLGGSGECWWLTLTPDPIRKAAAWPQQQAGAWTALPPGGGGSRRV